MWYDVSVFVKIVAGKGAQTRTNTHTCFLYLLSFFISFVLRWEKARGRYAITLHYQQSLDKMLDWLGMSAKVDGATHICYSNPVRRQKGVVSVVKRLCDDAKNVWYSLGWKLIFRLKTKSMHLINRMGVIKRREKKININNTFRKISIMLWIKNGIHRFQLLGEFISFLLFYQCKCQCSSHFDIHHILAFLQFTKSPSDTSLFPNDRILLSTIHTHTHTCTPICIRILIFMLINT